MNNHTDQEAIEELLRNYTDGTYRADKNLLQSVFHEKAVMNGYIGPALIMADPTPFIQDITSSPSMESNNDPYHSLVESIRIEGNVATAVVSETGFRGDAVFVDFFHLIKTDEKWRIISKLFTTL